MVTMLVFVRVVDNCLEMSERGLHENRRNPERKGEQGKGREKESV
jgi:hypothetical protein